MQNNSWRVPLSIGAAFIIIAVAATVLNSRVTPPLPAPGAALTATSTPETASTTASYPSSGQTAATNVGPFPINVADTIASWSFKGAYAGNDALIAQANADIVHLSSLLGKGQYDNYDLYNGIANDKNYLGDGTGAYGAYNRAIAIHPDKSLAYANLGNLFDELGAYRTAADAYTKAVEVEPAMLQYHLQRLGFLIKQFPTDDTLLLAAFADANKQFGDTASILALEAQWYESRGRYADAIRVWKIVKTLSPKSSASAIDAQIARDAAKE